jgi:nucleoside 2-deoxyribosyltransferase
MPVGSDPSYPEKREIMGDVAQSLNIQTHFPLESKNASDFDLLTTLQELERAEFVLADLSFERPSCYYELGLAQALHKQVFLIAQEGTTIHQAYGREKTHFYNQDRDFRNVIEEAIHAGLA